MMIVQCNQPKFSLSVPHVSTNHDSEKIDPSGAPHSAAKFYPSYDISRHHLRRWTSIWSSLQTLLIERKVRCPRRRKVIRTTGTTEALKIEPHLTGTNQIDDMKVEVTTGRTVEGTIDEKIGVTIDEIVTEMIEAAMADDDRDLRAIERVLDLMCPQVNMTREQHPLEMRDKIRRQSAKK